MRFPHLSPSVLELGVRWTARLLAAALLAVILLIFIGEGFNPFRLTKTEAIQMTFFFSTCIGMAIAWRWPLIGGAISTAGILLFFAVEFALTGWFPQGLFFYLMLLPGILFLSSAFLRRRMIAMR
jgi:hypothetical protein